MKDNRAIEDLGVEAYLGMPLTLPNGAVIGSLCAIDGKPRHWSDDDQTLLRELARCVMAEVIIRDRSDHARTIQGNLVTWSWPVAAAVAAFALAFCAATVGLGPTTLAAAAAAGTAAVVSFRERQHSRSTVAGLSYSVIAAGAITVLATAWPSASQPVILSSIVSISILWLVVWLNQVVLFGGGRDDDRSRFFGD